MGTVGAAVGVGPWEGREDHTHHGQRHWLCGEQGLCLDPQGLSGLVPVRLRFLEAL